MTTTTDLIRASIKQGLKDSGKTQRELAQYLRFSETHVSQMMNGKAGISLDYLPHILDFVGLRLAINKKEDSE